MYNYIGSRQTNGATANYSSVGGFPAAEATAIPVPAVSGNVLLPNFGLMHNFSQQAHSFDTTGVFANATLNESPTVRSSYETFGLNFFTPMLSRSSQASPLRRRQATIPPPSP